MESISHLVYVSPVRLHSAVQRPHHFVAWARQRWGCTVTWVDPYPVRLPTARDVTSLYGNTTSRQERLIGPVWANEPWLRRLSIPAIPFDPIWAGRRLNQLLRRGLVAELRDELSGAARTLLAVGRPCELAMQLLRFPNKRSLYDVMDDMPQFYKGISSRWMARVHAQLLCECDTVWCSSSALLRDALAHGRTDSVLVGNAGSGCPSVNLTHRPRGAPWVAGYVGTLGTWFDWKCLAEWATRLPDIRWEVVGALSADIPADLPHNVDLLGPLPHHEVMKTMQSGWDVGLIPFLKTALTHAVDPVKYYEYRQCGLPVLSSRFGEMAHKTDDHGVWLMDELAPTVLPHLLNRWWSEPTHGPKTSAPDWLMTWPKRFDQGARAIGIGIGDHADHFPSMSHGPCSDPS